MTNVSFVTRELTFLQKAAQAYWLQPRVWLLDRLDCDGATITIRRRNGAVDCIHPGSFQCTFGTDKSGRREFKIVTSDGRKIRFNEIAWMLADAEWNAIAELLGATESNWNKVVHAASVVVQAAKRR